MLELVLGGARSGKSGYALAAAQSGGRPVTLIATAEARDSEMAERINRHRQSRSGAVEVVEAPLGLARALADTNPECAVVVDCLTLWLSNCLTGSIWPSERRELLAILAERAGPIWLVSNEVGSGIVPLGQLSRQFADEAGWLHQDIAATAARVTLMIAGLPLSLKPGNHVN